MDWHSACATVQWYASTNADSGDGPHEALVAVASVAAVAWTGGFIIRGFSNSRTTEPLIDAMDHLQFAFLLPIIALIATPYWLRIATVPLLAYYAVNMLATAVVRHVRVIDRWSTLITYVTNINRWDIRRWTGRYAIIDFLILASVFRFPHREIVAWLAVLRLYIGYKGLLSALYSDAAEQHRAAESGRPPSPPIHEVLTPAASPPTEDRPHSAI